MSPETEPTIDDVWYEIFGHSYGHCVQLAALENEIGEIHRKHLDYINRLINNENSELDKPLDVI